MSISAVSVISQSEFVASIREFEAEFLEALLLQEIEEALAEGPNFGEFIQEEEEEELNNVMKQCRGYVGYMDFGTFSTKAKREEREEWTRQERKALKAKLYSA